jgi:singapore isolate B (sub-type 7) whole genome shotgun sequence assembly, scaffold_4
MKKFIATAGVALLMTAPAAAYAADTTPEIKAEVTKATSASRQTSSEVNVAGTWTTERLAVGQQFTVTSKDGGFKWNASFPFALNGGTVVGECNADQATLTCKVTEVPESYKDKTNVSGTWWARARLQDAAVGTNEGTITLNGEVVKKLIWGDAEGTGVCTKDCDSPAHFEYARPENLKFGWGNDNGTVGWAIKWVANAGVEYTVKDFDTTLGTSVRCATTDTWDPATTKVIDATRIDSNMVKFAAPEGSKVCITYPPEQMRVPEGKSSVTNHAEVNGLKLEATATIRSNGGTDGDGSVKPTPTPAPNPSTEPSEPTPTPSDEPTPTPTQTPCTIHPDRDKDRVPCKIEPVPAPTKATPAPAKPAPTIEAPKAKLAKTGAASEAAVIGILSLLFGAAIVAVAWFVGRYGTTR